MSIGEANDKPTDTLKCFQEHEAMREAAQFERDNIKKIVSDILL